LSGCSLPRRGHNVSIAAPNFWDGVLGKTSDKAFSARFGKDPSKR
jgi:hypothetical protein